VVFLLGLSSTLFNLAANPEPGTSVAEQEMADLASKVVEDVIEGGRGGGGGVRKWKSLVEKTANIEGLGQGELSLFIPCVSTDLKKSSTDACFFDFEQDYLSGQV
jgi:hypothetical protein